ncbi:MAG TPA: DUF5916 domain-containing protein, partial [Pyrinomonadaceae bacterium]|nr:DUF5916 domain-containing protein [Pyrinomonadaceae bacterium]
LDDAVWQKAAVLGDFYQIQPGDNIAPSRRTEVLLGYDSKTFYIAYHCYDEPGSVRSTVPKRDQIFDDDYVGALFDTFNDQRRAYEIDINPLGVQADGIWDVNGNEDFSYDMVFDSKGSVTSDGYVIEIAIPFKSLRYNAGEGKMWGVHFFRRIKRFNNELDMWMPINRDITSWLTQEGHITGLVGISTEHTLELIPSLTLSETGVRRPTLTPFQQQAGQLDPGRIVNEPIHFDPGLNIKYTLTPTVTLDAAINPDFAQVEADQLVVTANQRFPIFFAEKRPFFLEGIDYFQTQIAAVHTRAIVDPDWAVKLTGKMQRNTFGILLASDNAPGNFNEDDRAATRQCQERRLINPREVCPLERFIDRNATIGIIRLKHDIGSESNIGFLATGYRFIDQYNYLGGFDGRWKINKVTSFSAQVLATVSRNNFFFPDLGQTLDRRENGFIYATDYGRFARHTDFEYSTVGRTRFYRSDAGFNRRVNTNNHNIFAQYRSEPQPKAQIISWRVYTDLSTNFDWQRHLQIWSWETQGRVNLRRQSYLAFGVNPSYERVFEGEFGPRRTATRPGAFFGADPERSTYKWNMYAYGGSTPTKKFDFFFFGSHTRNEFDFDFGAGPKFPRVSRAALALGQGAPLDPGPGNFWHIEGDINYRPTQALRSELSFVHESLRRNDTGLTAFIQNIVTLRTTYQFTRFLSARARLDYDSVGSDIRGQFLLGWAPNPGTAFYLGYNDDMNRNGFNPFTGQIEPGFRRNGRTFFIKMSYLFRKSFGG